MDALTTLTCKPGRYWGRASRYRAFDPQTIDMQVTNVLAC